MPADVDGFVLIVDGEDDEDDECKLLPLVLKLASGKSGFILSDVCSAFSWRLHFALLF